MQVTYAANDDVLVTAGYDQCVKLWDMKSRSMDALQTMKAFRVCTIPLFLFISLVTLSSLSAQCVCVGWGGRLDARRMSV